MKASLKKKFGRERGFTLTELAVAMLVVGILSAIAVPSFLGSRNSAFDKEAQAAVDAAMTAARTHYAQYGDFSSAESVQCFHSTSKLHEDLQKIEPTLDFIHALQGSTGPRVVSVAGWNSWNSAFERLGCQVFYAAALSRSGTCWIGRITVEGKYLWPATVVDGETTSLVPIIVHGDKNTENAEQVSMTGAALNGNAYAAFKPQSPAADQTVDERETLALSQSLCNGFDSVEGIFPTGDDIGLVRTYEYYDSWRNVVRAIPTTETTSTTSTTVYTEP